MVSYNYEKKMQYYEMSKLQDTKSKLWVKKSEFDLSQNYEIISQNVEN